MNIIEDLVIIEQYSPIVGEVTSVVTAKKEKNPGLSYQLVMQLLPDEMNIKKRQHNTL